MRGCHRALYKRNVIRARPHSACGLQEECDVYRGGQIQQLVFHVEQGQLAAIARRELVYGNGRSAACHQNSSTLKYGSNASKRNIGPSLQMKYGPSWQCPQAPCPHFMLRSRETNMLSGEIRLANA